MRGKKKGKKEISACVLLLVWCSYFLNSQALLLKENWFTLLTLFFLSCSHKKKHRYLSTKGATESVSAQAASRNRGIFPANDRTIECILFVSFPLESFLQRLKRKSIRKTNHWLQNGSWRQRWVRMDGGKKKRDVSATSLFKEKQKDRKSCGHREIFFNMSGLKCTGESQMVHAGGSLSACLWKTRSVMRKQRRHHVN